MGTLKWNTVPSQRLTSGFLRNRLCHLEDLCHLCDLCHLHGRGSFSFEYMPALTHERKSKRLMLACRKRRDPKVNFLNISLDFSYRAQHEREEWRQENSQRNVSRKLRCPGFNLPHGSGFEGTLDPSSLFLSAVSSHGTGTQFPPLTEKSWIKSVPTAWAFRNFFIISGSRARSHKKPVS